MRISGNYSVPSTQVEHLSSTLIMIGIIVICFAFLLIILVLVFKQRRHQSDGKQNNVEGILETFEFIYSFKYIQKHDRKIWVISLFYASGPIDNTIEMTPYDGENSNTNQENSPSRLSWRDWAPKSWNIFQRMYMRNQACKVMKAIRYDYPVIL